MTTRTVKGSLGQVYVVDDDADVRESVTCTLRSVGYAVETYREAAEFLSGKAGFVPSVVIVDMLLPGMTGLGLCREIVRQELPCAFVVISGHADVSSAVETMRLGAIDLLEKPFGRQRLLEVVNKALHVAHARYKLSVEKDEAVRRLSQLSPREREVFDAVASGLVTKEIAKRLQISTRTVDVHRSHVMQKLKIQSSWQLATLLAIVGQKRPSGIVSQGVTREERHP